MADDTTSTTSTTDTGSGAGGAGGADTGTQTTSTSTTDTGTTDTGTGGAGDDVPPEVRKALTKANKEAETLRLKLKEFEDRDKTELEKATERAAEAEKKLATAERQAFAARIAAETDTPIEALHGSTEEELRESAKRLVEWRGGAKKPAPKASALKSGSSKTTTSEDRKQAAADAVRRLSGATPN